MTDDTTDKPRVASEPMSHERLAAIHGRLAPISAWPWEHPYDDGLVYMAPDSEGQRRLVNKGGGRPLDAEFIAHAPEDVDALLAEVDRLRALLGGVVQTAETYERKLDSVEAMLASGALQPSPATEGALVAEVHRLRERLEQETRTTLAQDERIRALEWALAEYTIGE